MFFSSLKYFFPLLKYKKFSNININFFFVFSPQPYYQATIGLLSYIATLWFCVCTIDKVVNRDQLVFMKCEERNLYVFKRILLIVYVKERCILAIQPLAHLCIVINLCLIFCLWSAD